MSAKKKTKKKIAKTVKVAKTKDLVQTKQEATPVLPEDDGTQKDLEIPGIGKLDVANLDLDKLRDQMLKGIYVLESALFSQAGFEFNRIGDMRSIVSQLEGDLFNEETLRNMDEEQKIRLYQVVLKNMQGSMDFLQNLHRSVEQGVSTLTQLEKLKVRKPDSVDTDANVTPELEEIKAKIQQKIKEKTGD